MGPRSFNRGKPRAWLSSEVQQLVLQWGLGLSTEESTATGKIFRTGGEPSMGPRSFNRGKRTLGLDGSQCVFPSMGPRSFNRGKDVEANYGALDPKTFNGASVFQPRKVSAALIQSTPLASLQWGLGLSTEESRRFLAAERHARLAFNGASVFQPRKGIAEL